jgi:hypothetical protein
MPERVQGRGEGRVDELTSALRAAEDGGADPSATGVAKKPWE